MLFREIVYFEHYTKHTNTMCGPTVRFLNDKVGCTYSSQCAFKVLMTHVWIIKQHHQVTYHIM
jgi:hypothetical protein